MPTTASIDRKIFTPSGQPGAVDIELLPAVVEKKPSANGTEISKTVQYKCHFDHKSPAFTQKSV